MAIGVLKELVRVLKGIAQYHNGVVSSLWYYGDLGGSRGIHGNHVSYGWW